MCTATKLRPAGKGRPLKRWECAAIVTIVTVALGACSTDAGGAKPSASASGTVTQLPALGAAVRRLDNEVVGVACGVCIYGMQGGDDCPLAAEIGDKQYYFVTLKLKDEFDTHGVGLCDAAAKARVSGELYEHGVVVTSIALLPEK